MNTTLFDILDEAKRLFAGSFSDGYNFPSGFKFSPRGRPAYELVLDASPSMDEPDYSPSRFVAAKQAATRFLQKCAEKTPDALVGTIFYAKSAKVAAPLQPARMSFEHLCQAISSGEISDYTNLGAGLIAAGQEFIAQGNGICPTAVVLTDGHSNTGPSPILISSQLKEMGVSLEIIGIGGSPDHVNERELKQMASVRNGNIRYWFIKDVQELIKRFELLGLRAF